MLVLQQVTVWNIYLIFSTSMCAGRNVAGQAGALSSGCAVAGSLKVCPSKIVLAPALCVHTPTGGLLTAMCEHIQDLMCKMTDPTLLYPPRGWGCFWLLIFSSTSIVVTSAFLS